MSRQEMEARRIEAENLLRAGVRQADLVRRFKVSRTSASRWARRMESPSGMNKRRGTGRPRLTTDEELRRIWASRSKWTGKRFADAISTATGIAYDADHGGRLLRSLRGLVNRKRGAGGLG